MLHRPRVAVRLMFPLFFAWITGCAHLPMTGALPDGARITEVARVDAAAPFALDPQGELIAYGSAGLTLKELGSGHDRPVAAPAPTALAWSPDGKQLAASFLLGEESVLKLCDRQGGVLKETRLAGRVKSLVWRSSTEILAFAVQQRNFSFGSRLTELLYRWDGTGKPAETILHETTLMPATLRRWGDMLLRPLTFSLSPLGDEILYPRLHAPPLFTPYLQLVLRNLDGGAELEVAEVSLHSAGGAFSGDGEWLLYGDGEGESRLFDPWGKQLLAAFPTPGRSVALSPSGRYLLLDGRLYRDGKEIASFPAASAGAFSATGGRLLIRYGERLYLVNGLPDEPPVPIGPAERDRLRQLRKWREEGLITDTEYRASRKRMSK